MAYKAFISCGHSADGRLARAIQSALQRLERPWYRLGGFRIFLSDVDPSMRSGGSLARRALDASEFFILVASPEAAVSATVQRDVEHWLRRKPSSDLLIAVADGEIVWDESASDFDWEKTTALPTTLSWAFDEEPAYFDFRGTRSSPTPSLENPDFRERITDLAATLRRLPVEGRSLMRRESRPDPAVVSGRPPQDARSIANGGLLPQVAGSAQTLHPAPVDALELAPRDSAEVAALAPTLGEPPEKATVDMHVRRYRRMMWVAWGAAFGLLALALIATGLWRSAETRLKEGERREQAAAAWRLATEVALARNREPLLHQRNLLLGLEAMRRLASLGRPAVQVDQAVRELLAVSPRPLAAITTGARVTRLALGPRGQSVATGDTTGTIWVYDAASGAPQWRAEHAGRVTVLGWSADGRCLLSASADGTARLWDARTGREVVRVRHDKPVLGAALSSDGRRLVTGSPDGNARMWEVATGRELGHVFQESGVTAVSWSADGRWLGLSTGESVRLIEAATGRPVGRIPGGPATLGAVVLSPDGQRIATRAGDVTQIWGIPTLRPVLRVRDDPGEAGPAGAAGGGAEWRDDAIAFSPDGRWLATAHRDRTARLHDAQSGDEILRVRHAENVTGLAWSPDGRWLAIRSPHGARVLEAATGRDVARIDGNGPVWAVAFGGEARRLAVGSGETVRVWQLDTPREAAAVAHARGARQEVRSPADMIVEACGRLTRNLTRDEWRDFMGDVDYQPTCPNLSAQAAEPR